MQNERIHLERIKRLIERNKPLIYPLKQELDVLFISDNSPIPYKKAVKAQSWQPIAIGQVWGKVWESAWFKVCMKIPDSTTSDIRYSELELGLLFDCDGEACVFKSGYPWQGLTPKVDWYHNAAKRYVPLDKEAFMEEGFELLIEAAANDLFGAGKQEYALRECALTLYDSALQNLLTNIELLLNLAEALNSGNLRRQRIIYGLNEVCNLWNSNRHEAARILQELLSKPANATSLTAISVGHAHLDLAWLWPLRETKRKGGRSFANALRLMESYPQYIFGASQAQLYKWMKEDYPELFKEVKQAVKQNRWELQGASWVEFDTNIPSGESLIRQFMYGSRFFKENFGEVQNVLWLPDCFGFNGNLPQILKGCKVDYFMTQKLSWNESNTFPHHLFVWQGIDGSEVMAHQLPTNDYNFSNNPSAFLETEKRFAEGDFSDAFLNLYGIGDGGGGPTRQHIEYGIRQQNLEGGVKFRFAKSAEFFRYYASLDAEKLPKVYGELYLELHRGTYTTQALMKKNNRKSEHLLLQAEFLAALTHQIYPYQLTKIWEDTLLLQFHDILPGSSIGLVYDEAKQICQRNQAILENYIQKTMELVVEPVKEQGKQACLLLNNSQWKRQEWVLLPECKPGLAAYTAKGKALQSINCPEGLRVKVSAEPFSLTAFHLEPSKKMPQTRNPANLLENDWLKAEICPQGTLKSLYLKSLNRQILASESNLLLLWEDEPNNWGAWDINHFYRETIPQKVQQAELLTELCSNHPGKLQRLVHKLTIGNSTIIQTIELSSTDRMLKIYHETDWQEHHKMLRVHFYTNIAAETASCEIPFGIIKRSCKPKNTWEAARFEVPAHRYADLSQADYGCAIINDCKYGYHILEGEIDINLLRSPADVDKNADLHKHNYGYAIYPHAGNYESSDVLPQAHIFNNPMPVNKTMGQLPYSVSTEFGFEAATVKLECIKPAETGSGIVVRMYEYSGSQAVAKLTVPKRYTLAMRCNMLEEPLEFQDLTSPIQLSFKPFEIITLRFEEAAK